MPLLMKYKLIGFFAFLAVVWIGHHYAIALQERSRVAKLPTSVNLRGSYSAKKGIEEATRVAKLWDQTSQLQMVDVAFEGDPHSDDPGIGPDGIPIPPSGWNYRFYSSQRGWFLDLTILPDGRCTASSFNGIDYRDTQPLPKTFLDSTDILAIAEETYGQQYRQQGKLFRLPTRLTTWRSHVSGPDDPIPHRATWQIHYLTTRGKNRVDLYLTFDAVTGKELCAVEFVNAKMNLLTNHFPAEQ